MSWFSFLTWPVRPRRATPRTLRLGNEPNRKRRHVRPRLEELECRNLPSTLTVLNNADSGLGSLRDTIAAAQNGDTIIFDPSLDGQTISLTSGELAINQSLSIRGP